MIIDYAVSQQGEGNKGELKFLFSCLKSLIKKVGIRNTEEVFLSRNKRNPESIFTRLLDLTLKCPDLTNRFLYFVEKLETKGCNKKIINTSARKYFKANRKEIINLLIHYIDNNYNQELLSILTMIVFFDIKFPFAKLKPRYIFSSSIDDFNLIIFSFLYRESADFNSIKFIKYVSKIFDKVDSGQDSAQMGFMQRKHWMFRYYFFYLSSFELIDSKDIHKYFSSCGTKIESHETKDDSAVFKTGIDYKWVLEYSNRDHPINKFYREMLENGVKLFDDSLIFTNK